MGKNKLNDFFGTKGYKIREEGMKKKEKKSRKWCYLVFFVLSTIVFLIFAGLHQERAGNAIHISDDYKVKMDGIDLKADYLFQVNTDMAAYDACKFPDFILDPAVSESEHARLNSDLFKYCLDRPDECKKGTQWLGVFQFNAAVLFVTAVNMIVLSFGAFYFCPRYWGSLCNLCYACCHCLACGAALGVTLSPIGQICSKNIAPSHYEGDWKWSDDSTYQSDAGMILGMGIVQFILWCVQCYCCCCPLLMTPRKEKERPSTVVNAVMMPAAGMAYPMQGQVMPGQPYGQMPYGQQQQPWQAQGVGQPVMGMPVDAQGNA